MIVYRVCHRTHAQDLTGEGARLSGGRWNSAGNPMIYAARSPALALLEVLAHATILPSNQVLVTLRLPSRVHIGKLGINKLPAGWNSLPSSATSQQIGDLFLREGQFLAIRVPSVILPEEENILINPRHASAKEIVIVSIENLPIDPRLK